MIKKCSMIEIRFQTFTPVQKKTWQRQPGQLPMEGKLEGLHSKPWCWTARRYRNTPVITSSDFHQRLNDWKARWHLVKLRTLSSQQPQHDRHEAKVWAETGFDQGTSMASWEREPKSCIKLHHDFTYAAGTYKGLLEKMDAALLDHTPNLIR
jgi:hypothetical protein